MAQPPLAWSPVGWLALVPWALLVTRPAGLTRRQCWAVWLAGAAYWLATMQGVRLAHPALYPGWFVLAAYLGVYPLLFVVLSRVMHHRWRWPLVVTVPTIWAGLEWVRSYAFTGFSGTLLGHSQVDLEAVVQIADLGGTYLVSFLLAAVSAVIAAVLSRRCWHAPEAAPSRATLTGHAAAVIVLLLLSLGYGSWRMSQNQPRDDQAPVLRALLIQRDEPLVFSMDPNREAEVFQNYLGSTLEAVAAERESRIDLVIWPESMFTGGLPYRLVEDDLVVPPQVNMDRDAFVAAIEAQQQTFVGRSRYLQTAIGEILGSDSPPLLMGGSVYRYAARPMAHGAAIFIDPDSQVAAWYGKRHLVMFGEYVPFGNWFPWLYDWTPLSQGTTPGPRPMSIPVNGAEVAPSICFETMVEQVTGNGLRQLRREGHHPDVIINLTNDAWFHGTAILDHHRRCSQMVALVNRRPLLMCANQGPTAWIDGNGQVVRELEHLTNDYLLARPRGENRDSLYRHIGDAVCWPLGLVCLAAAVSGWRAHRREKRARRAARA